MVRPGGQVGERPSVLRMVATIMLAGLCGVCRCSGGGYCSFPLFLWEPIRDGELHRTWISKTEYFGATELWEKQKNITVMETEIIIQYKVHASCHGYKEHGHVPCYRQQILYNIICVSEEPDGKYRVQQQSNGKTVYTCLKFVRRNNNVVQVFSAVSKEVNEDRLCYDSSLQREEWPWINPDKDGWEFCPLSGGYDFVPYIGNTNDKLCEEEQRPARVESECIKGESMTFYFHSQTCSPFNTKRSEQTLLCWGHWKEGNYMVVLLGYEGKLARYIMRVPISMTTSREPFTGYLYFSPVVPMSGSGTPPGTVMYLKLHMKHSDSGLCYDTSDDCPQMAKEGKCKNTAFHNAHLANSCMRSCGLCDLVPSEKAECHFPREFLGRWSSFHERHQEEIVIETGNVTFSQLGTYICKSIHWEKDYYKVLSVYDNGCRPRFSCLHLLEASPSVLQYRLSHSRLGDESFANVCTFYDDPLPLGNQIRSDKMKNLLPYGNMRFGSCGLSGLVHINVTFADGKSCDGLLSDTDQKTCKTKPLMDMDLHRCYHQHTGGLACVAYAFLPRGTGFLVTQLTGSPTEYTCWIIKGDIGRKGGSPWREVFQFDRAYCSTGEIVPFHAHTTELMTIRTYNDMIERSCKSEYNYQPFKLFKSFLKSDSGSFHTTVSPTTSLNYWLAKTTSSTAQVTSLVKRTRKQEYISENGHNIQSGAAVSFAGSSNNRRHLSFVTSFPPMACVFVSWIFSRIFILQAG